MRQQDGALRKLHQDSARDQAIRHHGGPVSSYELRTPLTMPADPNHFKNAAAIQVSTIQALQNKLSRMTLSTGLLRHEVRSLGNENLVLRQRIEKHVSVTKALQHVARDLSAKASKHEEEMMHYGRQLEFEKKMAALATEAESRAQLLEMENHLLKKRIKQGTQQRTDLDAQALAENRKIYYETLDKYNEALEQNEQLDATMFEALRQNDQLHARFQEVLGTNDQLEARVQALEKELKTERESRDIIAVANRVDVEGLKRDLEAQRKINEELADDLNLERDDSESLAVLAQEATSRELEALAHADGLEKRLMEKEVRELERLERHGEAGMEL